MRKLLAVFVFTLLTALFVFPVYASDIIRVTVDGRPVNFPDAQPVIVHGRTLVPMRGVFEQMGFVGDWNPITETSTLIRAGMTISVRRGDPFFTVNGMQQFPEVPPQLLGGRFMIPLRAVAESTGANVSWNENIRTVIITTGAAQQPIVVVPQPVPAPPLWGTPVIDIISQAGSLRAGTAGTVNFVVTTQNIPNGPYQISLINAPAGITLDSTNININGNMGTLRLNGSTATQQGRFNMTVRLNLGGNRGTIDQNLTLDIDPPQFVYMSVGSQTNTVTQGVGGSASFVITTQGLPNGNYSISTTGNWPQGVTLASNNVAIVNGSGSLIVNVAPNAAAGPRYVSFIFSASGAVTGGQPVSFTRQIRVNVTPGQQQFTLGVGSQIGTVTQGTGGQVSFGITTNLPNTNASITTTGTVPQGITLASNNVWINNGSGSLYLNVPSSAAVGTHRVHFMVTAQGQQFPRHVDVIVSPGQQNFQISVSVMSGTGGNITRFVNGQPITGNLAVTQVQQGDTLELIAVPHTGWTFGGWFEGGVFIGGNETLSFTATSNRTITAVFSPITP